MNSIDLWPAARDVNRGPIGLKLDDADGDLKFDGAVPRWRLHRWCNAASENATVSQALDRTATLSA